MVAREGFEPPDRPVMSGLLYLAELSRHSWPPRDRTARYLRIRQAPSTSWVVASRWRRSRPQALTRPIRFQAGACRPAGSPSSAERGGLEPQRAPARPSAFGAVPVRLPGSLSGKLLGLEFATLSRLMPRICNLARRMEIPTPSALQRPFAFQAKPAPRPVHPPWRSVRDSNPRTRRCPP